MSARRWDAVDALVAAEIGYTFPAATIEVRQAGALIYARAYGSLNPDGLVADGLLLPDAATTLHTRFDLASVSKLFVVTAFMTYVEEGRVGLQTPVSAILPTFSGRRVIQGYPNPRKPAEFVEVSPATPMQVDASHVTFADLLVHNSGLPAWWPLFVAPSLAERRSLAKGLPFAYVPHTRVVYSDIGLILVGQALEVLADRSLDQVVAERVAAPLELRSLHYSPVACENVAPTRAVYDRKQVLCGVVHDDNARSLGGVAGHAGLFANVHDVAELGEALRRGGCPVLQAAIVADMTQLHAEDGATRRGIGFSLWSPDPEASSHPFSPQTYGHTGFTGTSIWIDPVRELVVAVLTNRVYYGDETADAMVHFRVRLHAAICAAVD